VQPDKSSTQKLAIGLEAGLGGAIAIGLAIIIAFCCFKSRRRQLYGRNVIEPYEKENAPSDSKDMVNWVAKDVELLAPDLSFDGNHKQSGTPRFQEMAG
jgi:hypothetical protein